ncbi:arginase family protein [Oceanospirillum sp. RT-1-3]|uniref:arginase family protein n=1 Tax=unclassified Halobacteriovorax TaxID=2639665 RepID=UPI00399A7F83
MGWKEIDDNLNKRKSQSIATRFKIDDFNSQQALLLSENDLGVVRNGGRRGASHGPKVILSQLKKFADHNSLSELGIISIANQGQLDFDKMQAQSIEKIKKIKAKKLVHLGGGHDHVYPLAMGVELKNPLLINIDAHLDTRSDDVYHSGTPFRQVANQKEVKILQIGIHQYANVPQNYEGMKMDIIDTKKLKELSLTFSDTSFMKEIYETHDGDILFSIDADAIAASDMQSVSAVNHDGIPLEFLRKLVSQYKEYTASKKQILGIYEYNPLFDELSAKDARALASLIYDFLV